jgi:hypothetical protein
MSRDKLQGLMIGLGAGVLVATFMNLSEALAKRLHETIDDGREPLAVAPPDVTARAADAQGRSRGVGVWAG